MTRRLYQEEEHMGGGVTMSLHLHLFILKYLWDIQVEMLSNYLDINTSN